MTTGNELIAESRSRVKKDEVGDEELLPVKPDDQRGPMKPPDQPLEGLTRPRHGKKSASRDHPNKDGEMMDRAG